MAKRRALQIVSPTCSYFLSCISIIIDTTTVGPCIATPLLSMFIYRHSDLPAVNDKVWISTANKRPVNGKNTCLGNKKLCLMKCLQNVSKFASFYLYSCFFHFLFHVTLLFPLWIPKSISTKHSNPKMKNEF